MSDGCLEFLLSVGLEPIALDEATPVESFVYITILPALIASGKAFAYIGCSTGHPLREKRTYLGSSLDLKVAIRAARLNGQPVGRVILWAGERRERFAVEKTFLARTGAASDARFFNVWSMVGMHGNARMAMMRPEVRAHLSKVCSEASARPEVKARKAKWRAENPEAERRRMVALRASEERRKAAALAALTSPEYRERRKRKFWTDRQYAESVLSNLRKARAKLNTVEVRERQKAAVRSFNARPRSWAERANTSAKISSGRKRGIAESHRRAARQYGQGEMDFP